MSISMHFQYGIELQLFRGGPRPEYIWQWAVPNLLKYGCWMHVLCELPRIRVEEYNVQVSTSAGLNLLVDSPFVWQSTVANTGVYEVLTTMFLNSV